MHLFSHIIILCYLVFFYFTKCHISFFANDHHAAGCLQEPKPQKMLLSGYGVELAIKSTEYKAVDDTKVKGQFVTRQLQLLFLLRPKSIHL